MYTHQVVHLELGVHTQRVSLARTLGSSCVKSTNVKKIMSRNLLEF